MVDEYLLKLCILDAVDCGWISVPGIRRALLDGSAASEPASAQPASIATSPEPAASQPSSAKPASAKSTSTKPSAEPASPKSATTEPASTEPASAEPAAIAASPEPSAAEPAATRFQIQPACCADPSCQGWCSGPASCSTKAARCTATAAKQQRLHVYVFCFR